MQPLRAFCLIVTGSILAIALGVRPAHAQTPPAAQPAPQPAAKVELNELEQAFADLMNGCALIGTFTIDGRDDGPARSERYEIKGATKVKDDNWLISARVVYGKIDVVVPVPVKMNWAGDTPVLSVTNLAIPLIGEQFTTRLLFYDGRYAGTWAHGKIGGHMMGRIEKAEAGESGDASMPEESEKKSE